MRYSDEDVVSHDANTIRCTPVENSGNILLLTGDVDVVGIDEAQFFDSNIVSVCKTLADNGIRVIVAGLDMDYTGKPFGPMPDLMGCGRICDESTCDLCPLREIWPIIPIV